MPLFHCCIAQIDEVIEAGRQTAREAAQEEKVRGVSLFILVRQCCLADHDVVSQLIA